LPVINELFTEKIIGIKRVSTASYRPFTLAGDGE
jgi:hypothetical protein